MATYKTPGVYIEEIALFPPSVAQVETAIPAFIGYTEKHKKDNDDLNLVPLLSSPRLDMRVVAGTALVVIFRFLRVLRSLRF